MQASGAPNCIDSQLAVVARLQRLSNSRDSSVQVFDSFSHVCEHFGFENLGLQVSVLPELPVAYGGFAAVYRGELESSFTVAVKLLKKTEKEDKERMLKRLAREALVLSSVEHPHIAKFYGIAELNGLPALVMEWYDRGTAADYLRGKDPEQKLAVVKDVAHGLEYLHAQNVIHGDMKGNNVLITHAKRAVLTDFGLSRILDAPTGTTTSTMPGSIRYQSPELIPLWSDATAFTTVTFSQPQGVLVKTKASDVWAFGCTAFELLSGTVPYAEIRNQSSVAETIYIAGAIRRGTLPGTFSRLVPGRICGVLDQCWRFQASKRPKMTIVASELE